MSLFPVLFMVLVVCAKLDGNNAAAVLAKEDGARGLDLHGDGKEIGDPSMSKELNADLHRHLRREVKEEVDKQLARRGWNFGGNLNHNNGRWNAGLNGGYTTNNGWKFGGHVNRQWGAGGRPSWGGGLSVSKSWGRRSLECQMKCRTACKNTGIECFQGCVAQMC